MPRSDQARKEELLQLVFVCVCVFFNFHKASRNIKMGKVRSMAFSSQKRKQNIFFSLKV